MKFPISFYTKFIPTLKNLCLQVKTTERGCEIKALRGSFTALETILEGGVQDSLTDLGIKPSLPSLTAGLTRGFVAAPTVRGLLL